MASERVATSFAETLPLSRPAIAGLLRLSLMQRGAVTEDDLRAQLLLGNNYIKAMPRYARACGLVNFASLKLTSFGERVAKNDPELSREETLWLMHYHLSAQQGPGPVFWSYLVRTMSPPGDKLDRKEAGRRVVSYLGESEGTQVKLESAEAAAGAFLSTYVKPDGLGPLGVVQRPEGSEALGYLVGAPVAPSASVIGYALADHWESHFPGSNSIALSEVTDERGLAPSFFMSTGLFASKFSELQRLGHLQLQRAVRPHQLIRLWNDKGIFLQDIYG